MNHLKDKLYEAQNLIRGGKYKIAEECLHEVFNINSDSLDAHNLIAIVYFHLGRIDEAINHSEYAVMSDPGNVVYLNNLGGIYQGTRKYAQAIDTYNKILSLSSSYVPAIRNIASCYYLNNDINNAAIYCREWIRFDSNNAEAYLLYGNILAKSTKPIESIKQYQMALRLAPELDKAHYALGGAYIRVGRLDEAIDALRIALKQNPTNTSYHTLFINALGYSDAVDPESLSKQLGIFNAFIMRKLKPVSNKYDNSPDQFRKIRIGYLMPDLLVTSSLTPFVLPIFRHHDHKQFAVYGYYNHILTDESTRLVASLTDAWRPCALLKDAELQKLIREDKIDILIDLVGYFSSNRIEVFAEKPAPIQVSWFGYPGDTGLESIDYKFSDSYLNPEDPQDLAVNRADNKTMRLIAHYCFEPPENLPEVSSLPALSNGFVTFAVLSNNYKINRFSVSMWSEILKGMPNGKLMIGDVNDENISRIRTWFHDFGISEDRLVLIERKPFDEFLRLHNKADIALDPYPFTGGLTSLLGSMMGLPFISLSGGNALRRQGAMILSHMGLDYLVAHGREEYIKRALDLASDLSELAQLRLELRGRLLRSVLTDAPAVTKSAEDALRNIWQLWCRT